MAKAKIILTETPTCSEDCPFFYVNCAIREGRTSANDRDCPCSGRYPDYKFDFSKCPYCISIKNINMH